MARKISHMQQQKSRTVSDKSLYVCTFALYHTKNSIDLDFLFNLLKTVMLTATYKQLWSSSSFWAKFVCICVVIFELQKIAFVMKINKFYLQMYMILGA